MMGTTNEGFREALDCCGFRDLGFVGCTIYLV